jgi:geranylgeranyl pyrophosphate synthase
MWQAPPNAASTMSDAPDLKMRACIERDRRLINRELDRLLAPDQGVPAGLLRAMRYAVLGPGKRIRPLLCLAAFRAAGSRNLRCVLPFCCGIEFIHAFSLAHDDLPAMDDDDFRRGRPSLHRRFDEATAILAADGLFARAFGMFARAPAPPERRLAAIAAVCQAVGPAGMTGGQFTDIAGHTGLSGRRLARMQRQKTAELIAVSLVTGATIAGAGAYVQQSLRKAGMHLGALFQITDDLIDERQQSDERLTTMASRYGVEAARQRAAREARAAQRVFSELGPDYDLLGQMPRLILERES